MAPAHKLIYFDGRGAAEVARWLFKYGNVDFEDVRIKKEDWPQMKESTPFGQLPLLEHKGKQINQSVAIYRYIGKLVKLGGKDDWENLEIDAIVDTLTDVQIKMRPYFYEQDPEKKKALQETVKKETAPYYLSRLEAQVKKNKGHLVCGKLTWADFCFTGLSGHLKTHFQISLDDYPSLKALTEKIEGLPAIKKWIAERPVTEF